MIRGTHTRFDFDVLAKDYDRWYESAVGKAHDRQQKAAVRQLLPSPADNNAKLLDVGCGTGHWSRFHASLGYHVTGIDLSQQMIQQANSQVRGDCLFGIADAHRLPFDDGTFDVVSAMAAIEFVSSAETIVAEMFRCVREDGAVVVGALNRLAPLNRHRVATGKEPYSSARLFSPAELRDLLASCGAVRMRMADPGIAHDEKGQNGAFIVARASRPATAVSIQMGADDG